MDINMTLSRYNNMINTYIEKYF